MSNDFSPNVNISNLICSLISIISCSIVVFTFIKIKEINSNIHTTLFCIALSEILGSIARLFSIPNYNNSLSSSHLNHPLCHIQSFIIILSDTSTQIYICLISLIIYNQLTKIRNPLKKTTKLFVILGLIFSIIITIVIQFLFYYPKNKDIEYERNVDFLWCWVKRKNASFLDPAHLPMQVMLSIYGVLMLITCIFVFKTLIYSHKMLADNKNVTNSAIDNQLNLTFIYKTHINNLVGEISDILLMSILPWIITLLHMIFYFDHTKKESEYNHTIGQRFVILSYCGMSLSLKGFFVFIKFFSSKDIQRILEKNGMLKWLTWFVNFSKDKTVLTADRIQSFSKSELYHDESCSEHSVSFNN